MGFGGWGWGWGDEAGGWGWGMACFYIRLTLQSFKSFKLLQKKIINSD
jgi:hypothetical protein